LQIHADEFLKRCEDIPPSEVNLNVVSKALRSGTSFVTDEDLKWLRSYHEYQEEKKRKEEGRPKPKPAKTAFQKATEERAEQDSIRVAQKKAVSDFRLLLQHKYGSVVTGWRKKLDPESRGQLPSEDLRKGCVAVGFKGNQDDLWYALAGTEGFVVTLDQLAPEALVALNSFKHNCVARFGSMETAFMELMAKDAPLVTKAEFVAWCKEVKVDHGSDKMVWEYLDENCCGKILMSQLDSEAVENVFDEDDIEKADEVFKDLEPLPARP
jgi:hypothetical protein